MIFDPRITAITRIIDIKIKTFVEKFRLFRDREEHQQKMAQLVAQFHMLNVE